MRTQGWGAGVAALVMALSGCGGAQGAGRGHTCRCHLHGGEHGHHGEHAQHHGGPGHDEQAHGEHGHHGGHDHHHGGEHPHRHPGGHGHHRADAHGHHHGEGMTHDFSDVARFEAMFEAPGRAAWQRPVEVVALLGAAPGQTVVDLGAGTGYFLPFLAAAVGPTGRVVALDSEPAMVAYLQQRAEREGLRVVEARAVQPDDPGLAPASADAILIVDTWHHLPDRARYAARLRDALRPGGRVLVVDFTLESEQGPPVEARVAPEVVARELTEAGLTAEIVEGETLPDQYVVRGVAP